MVKLRPFFIDLKDFVKKAPLGGKILEVGAGRGDLYDELAGDVIPLKTEFLEHWGRYDTIIFCDVLHHNNYNKQIQMINHARELLNKNGIIIIKEWAKDISLITLFAYLVDFVMSGRTFLRSEKEWEAIINYKRKFYVKPHKNNVCFVCELGNGLKKF